ncbi:MAG: hypothetical protein DELT_00715 [Desulfovibrio sp.]
MPGKLGKSGKSACSFAFVDAVRSENYFEAMAHAQEVLEEYGDVLRYHEMLLTLALRRENVAAALEHCNEIISYGTLKGLDIAEFEEHRAALVLRLSRTRTMLAASFWDEVMRDAHTAPSRYAGVPLILAGEARREENIETGALFLVFEAGGEKGGRIACKLAACETSFISSIGFPRRVTVHGRFLSVSGPLVLLYPCYFLGEFETPWQ